MNCVRTVNFTLLLFCCFTKILFGEVELFEAGVSSPIEVEKRKSITSQLLTKAHDIDLYNVVHNRDYYDELFEMDVARLEESGIDEYITLEDIKNWRETKRLRKEMRDIPYTEWMKIADAMNIMKFTDQVTGIAKYGNKFKNYDYLVCFHGQAAWQKMGNQNHFSPAFVTWHRGYETWFEESLLAIDPTIEALPYWDFRRDINDPLHSIIFTDKYVGQLMGDTHNLYRIKDGPFQHWPIGDAAASGPGCTAISNMWGQLRNPIHKEKSIYVTRMGSAMCGETDVNIGSIEEWNECLNTTEYNDLYSFQACYENTFHADAHTFVGGTRSDSAGGNIVETDDIYTSGSCYSWAAGTWVGDYSEKNYIFKFYAHPVNDCFDCHKHCDIYDDNWYCNSCRLINEDGACSIVEGGGESGHDKNDTVVYTGTLNLDSDEYIWGDMLDAISSPNDPIFMFTHVNFDRYDMIWELLNYENRPYYKYPENEWAQGVNLDDVPGYEHPLKNVFSGFDDNKPLTNRDILDATTLDNIPYLYQDILDALELILTKKAKEKEKEKELEEKTQINRNKMEDESETLFSSEIGLKDKNSFTLLYICIIIIGIIGIGCSIWYYFIKMINSYVENDNDSGKHFVYVPDRLQYCDFNDNNNYNDNNNMDNDDHEHALYYGTV